MLIRTGIHERRGETVSNWMRRVLIEAAKKTLRGKTATK
jgi:hypothetical protein